MGFGGLLEWDSVLGVCGIGVGMWNGRVGFGGVLEWDRIMGMCCSGVR